MQKELPFWQLAGFSVVAMLGTLLHFVYEWTGESLVAAVFSGVNESTWEHMKLLYWPLMLVAVVQWFFLKEYKNFWCVKAVGTVLGLALIPMFFYTYNGAIGPSPDRVNIAIFYVSAAIIFALETRWLKTETFCALSPKICVVLLVVMGVLFAYFSFFPPDLPIFIDAANDTPQVLRFLGNPK